MACSRRGPGGRACLCETEIFVVHPIQVEGLKKNYAGLPAVKGIDLEVRACEVFGLLGPNGAGTDNGYWPGTVRDQSRQYSEHVYQRDQSCPPARNSVSTAVTCMTGPSSVYTM